MMRVLYVSHIDVRSGRAHVHNTLKTCEAIVLAGAELMYVNPDHAPDDLSTIFKRQGVVPSFGYRFLDRVGAGEQNQPSRIKRVWAIARMNFALMSFVWRNRHVYDVLYYRYHLLLGPAILSRYILRKPVIFESHYVYLHKRIAQAITNFAVYSANGVVAITEALRAHYRLSEERSIMSPCHGAELESVPKDSAEALRLELDLPLDRSILCYTGSLGATIQGISYEVETMVRVLADLPASYVSLVVGARSDQQKNTQDLIDLARELGVENRLIIRDWCDRSRAMRYLVASDILLMPRVGTAPGSSPTKMFDYVAVGKPIIAATTPPVVEILKDGDNALLVDADVYVSWSDAIHKLERDPSIRDRIIEGARKTADQYTWEARGRNILAFMKRFYATRV